MAEYSLKMTSIQFTEKVIELYNQARYSSYYHPKIRRGRSHTISAQVEDLLAAFLGFNLLNDFDIYVDQPITVVGIKKQLYPDIILSDQGILKSFIDVKMDLGWNRDGFVKFCIDKEKEIKNILSKDYNLKDGLTKTISTGHISNKLKYHVVIISDKNISDVKFKRNIEETKHLNYVKVYCLTSNQHPNTYDDVKKVLDLIKINNKQFEILLDNL